MNRFIWSIGVVLLFLFTSCNQTPRPDPFLQPQDFGMAGDDRGTAIATLPTRAGAVVVRATTRVLGVPI
jgi:hypothetical protein